VPRLGEHEMYDVEKFRKMFSPIKITSFQINQPFDFKPDYERLNSWYDDFEKEPEVKRRKDQKKSSFRFWTPLVVTLISLLFTVLPLLNSKQSDQEIMMLEQRIRQLEQRLDETQPKSEYPFPFVLYPEK